MINKEFDAVTQAQVDMFVDPTLAGLQGVDSKLYAAGFHDPRNEASDAARLEAASVRPVRQFEPKESVAIKMYVELGGQTTKANQILARAAGVAGLETIVSAEFSEGKTKALIHSLPPADQRALAALGAKIFNGQQQEITPRVKAAEAPAPRV